MYFEDCLKSIEIKVRETKNIFIQESIKGIKINVHTIMKQAYKVFDYG